MKITGSDIGGHMIPKSIGQESPPEFHSHGCEYQLPFFATVDKFRRLILIFAMNWAGTHIALKEVRETLSPRRWMMTGTERCQPEADVAKLAGERRDEAADEWNRGNGEERRSHAWLPWIGAVPNPRLGPMLVISEGGCLVPLFTAVDLVRGCRSFWQRTQG